MNYKPYHIEMKVEARPNGELLRYYVTGERSSEAALDLWQRIYRDCELHSVFTVHATVVLSGRIEPMSIPLLIRELIALNASRSITCAWVDLNPASFNDNLMGEKLPRPSSMNIKIFNSDEAAARWLATQIASE